MCRYGFKTYKSHYACFRCRKTFKQANDNDLMNKSEREIKCLECGDYMADLGLDFKSPRKIEVKKWKIIEGLYTIGKNFYSCGCIGPGYIPQNPIDYKLYLSNILTDYESTISQLQNQSLEACADKLARITYWSERAALVRTELSSL